MGPVDVELVEDDVVDGVGAGEGPGVGGRGGGTGLGPSALEDHDGLLDLGVLDLVDELLAVGDTLAVHSQDLGLGVLHDVVDDVGLVQVGLVAEGDEVGDSHSVEDGPVDDRGSDGSGLGEDGDVTHGGQQVRERGVDSGSGVHDSEAVGSEELDPGLLGDLDELLLELGSGGALLLEPGGEDGCVGNLRLPQLPDLLGHEGVLDCEHGELDGLPDLLDGGVGLQALDLPSLGVDGVELALEAGVDHVLEKHTAQLRLVIGGSNDCYGFRRE